jgi:transposase-like protein
MSPTAGHTPPPFCPNPECPFHSQPTGWQWHCDGCFSRRAAPYRVQRFRCCECGRRFSEQTFRTNYWLKRPDLLVPILHGLQACSGLRQLARSHRASPQTILLHANRLGRHCQLFHEQHRPRGALTEPIALDGFQSFEYSQFHPTWYHVVAGTDSHFFYGFTDSELRRSGTMTASQKRTRTLIEESHGKPDPRSIEKETAAVLALVCGKSPQVELHTDEHQDYPRALKRLKDVAFAHHTVSSRAVRDARNPLFAINLLDLLIRHGGSNHKRETIAFAKRRQMAIWRLWVMVVWRNYMKWVSEQRHEDTPAMRLGIVPHRLSAKRVLEERLFVTRVGLPERWRPYYWGKVATRMMPKGRPHRMRFAF